MKKVFFVLVLSVLTLLSGCATHVEFDKPDGGKIYWPPRSGDDVQIINNIVDTEMQVRSSVVQMSGDTVPDPESRYSTGQVAHMFFSTQVYGERRNIELICRFFDEKDRSYVGSKVVRVNLRARVGERRFDVIEINSISEPRSRRR